MEVVILFRKDPLFSSEEMAGFCSVTRTDRERCGALHWKAQIWMIFVSIATIYQESMVIRASVASWSVHKFEPSNICLRVDQDTGGGACGFNSYCILGDDQRPRCECPPGYSFLDPNDPGTNNFLDPQDCNGSEDANNFELRDKMNTDWPRSDYEHYQRVSEDWCRQACLADCFCAVAIFNNGDCWKKRNPLSNGRQDSSVDRRALIKVRKENSTNYRPGSGEGSNVSERSSLILAGLQKP